MRGIAAAALLPGLLAACAGEPLPPGLGGRITGAAGEPLGGVFVTARRDSVAVTVYTDGEGRYRLPRLAPGSYTVTARGPGYGPAAAGVTLPDPPDPALRHDVVLAAGEGLGPVSSQYLSILPPGETKRRFLLDCAGCHQLGAGFLTAGPRLRGEQEWREWVERMLFWAGPGTAFPVISPGRDPAQTARWLSEHLAPLAGSGGAPVPPGSPPAVTSGALRAVLTEYDLPDPRDVPHDLALDAAGRVVITGMLSHRMWVLEPATATFTEVPIPVPSANPRAVLISPAGTWWVVLGSPRLLAAYRPERRAWKLWDLGLYAHSLAREEDGTIWFNGHFSRDPELLGRLYPPDGVARTLELPVEPTPDGGSGLPYGLRLGLGGLWGTDLVGNRLLRLSTITEELRVHPLPTPASGPRRLDVDPGGSVWVPEFATGRLAYFEPLTGKLTEHPLPVSDALPYVVRVDPATRDVWIGTAGADALLRFDPFRKRFEIFPLPTRGALVRHLEIDPGTGTVWATYSPFPAVAPKVLRLEAPRY